MENDTLKIAEIKIEEENVPEGNYTNIHVRFIGIPENEIIYNGNWVEYMYEANQICDIPIGFSDNILKADCGGVPNICRVSQKKKYYCSCLYPGGVQGTGECNIHPTYSDYQCDNCNCTKDASCKVGSSSLGNGEDEIIEFGILIVKASNFVIVDKL